MIKWVEPVDGAQFRSYRVGHLVSVRAFLTHAVLPHADVAMRVDEPGKDAESFEVDDGCVFAGKRGANREDFSVFNQ
ncbi:hypothetical protein SDC9_194473 [bioreactor metagenome]|uniref:Uncharacterized protein n=1 Tax=bioreactor metagenome TaxID=1076179 RepID=A0A645IEY5_9ZZZZ